MGKVQNISKTHYGSLLIENMNKDQVPKLIEIKKLCDYEVIVVLHGRLNTYRRVITCNDLGWVFYRRGIVFRYKRQPGNCGETVYPNV